MGRLGAQISQARRRRRWTQQQLGDRVGLSASRIGQIERSGGSGLPPETWCALGVALGLALRFEYGRDPLDEPIDAGHLKLQELMLRLGRQLGVTRTFELPTRPADPTLSVDVGWRDNQRRVLILNECWNTFGSVNSSVRSTHRKIADAEQLAAAIGGDDGAYSVAACWIVRDTRRNRQLIGRYPEVFATTFPGSSAAWVSALTVTDAPVPDLPGLVWCDLHATRLFAWRRRPARSAAERAA